jgi:hypothetical protein
MAKIEGVCREVCEATEFVAIVTTGEDGPHVVGNWGDYMRALGIKDDLIILPAFRGLFSLPTSADGSLQSAALGHAQMTK